MIDYLAELAELRRAAAHAMGPRRAALEAEIACLELARRARAGEAVADLLTHSVAEQLRPMVQDARDIGNLLDRFFKSR